VTESVVWSPRLGAHLETSRKRAGMRRVDVAGRLRVSEETVRLWEKGAVQPSPEHLARIIAVLSLEIAEWSGPGDAPGEELPPFARRLRQERDGRGITQVQAAELLDVAQATYAGWESGRTRPSVAYFPSLAQFLGIPEVDVATLCATPFVVDYADWPPFGRFLGARRQELRLTRAALAEALGVAASTVVAWELGYRVPGANQIARLAEALSVERASLAAALPRRVASTPLGELILARQRELGLRSVDLAALTGTTEATVSRWVQGRSRPAQRNLARLAEALELPESQLVEAIGRAA
jgi:transcriptional regulator with XRE-family HTH domain